MKKYRVSLPIDVNGTIYRSGATVELDAETAKAYGHALIALPEENETEGEKNANRTNG
jgi:hypothetical protein